MFANATAPYAIQRHLLPGDSYTYNPTHDAFLIRDDLGRIRGTYNAFSDLFSYGIPYWADPLNVATVAAAQIKPETAAEINRDEYVAPITIEAPEPVIAMADSPQDPEDVLFGESYSAGAQPAPAPAPVSDGQRIFDVMIAAAQSGTLKAFSFETKSGAKGGWSE